MIDDMRRTGDESVREVHQIFKRLDSLEAGMTALGARQERNLLALKKDLQRIFEMVEQLKDEIASDHDEK